MLTEIPVGFPATDQKRENLLNAKQEIPQITTQNGDEVPIWRVNDRHCCSSSAAFLRGILSGLTMFLCCLAVKPRIENTIYSSRESILGRIIGGIISFWVLGFVVAYLGGVGMMKLIYPLLNLDDDDEEEEGDYDYLDDDGLVFIAGVIISCMLYLVMVLITLLRIIALRAHRVALHVPPSDRIMDVESVAVVGGVYIDPK